MNFDIKSRTIYLAKHGSHAYGTNIKSSDLDIKGICIPPQDILFGYLHKFEQYIQLVNNGHPNDLTIYALNKFAKLAADCNPNIIEVLFCDEIDLIKITPEGEQIRNERNIFLSTKARYTFSGYAHAQLKRIKTHRNWLLNPPIEPKRSQFNLKLQRSISKEELGAYRVMIDRNNQIDLPTHALELLKNENKYAKAKQTWDQYCNWKKNRNKARYELEEKFGYDTKHAMHLIRLMRMCREILQGCGVIVKRPDAEELIQIRFGQKTYEELIEEAEKIDAECNILYKNSPLPKKPPAEKINKLIIDITSRYLSKYC